MGGGPRGAVMVRGALGLPAAFPLALLVNRGEDGGLVWCAVGGESATPADPADADNASEYCEGLGRIPGAASRACVC